MNASFDVSALLKNEKEASVRSVIYETAGRMRGTTPEIEATLVAGLKDTDLTSRVGAAKGLEAYFRTHRNVKPASETTTALHQAFRDNSDATLRELVLLTMSASGDSDSDTLKLALSDTEPQVRRLGVMATKQWKDDASYIV